VEAAMARIIPTDEHPGAREAGAAGFLDRYLSGIDYIYAKPDGSGFLELDGPEAVAWRRRIDILRWVYVDGLAQIDERSRASFGRDFRHVPDEDQDGLLAEIERDESELELHLQGQVEETYLPFFHLLVAHTRQGYHCDPVYGGNREHVGWKAVGFHGPASLAEVHAGRYTTDEYFASQEAR
jgi:gluconate 2-dehydrogenase gamma chain